MATPKISNFIIGLVWISFFAAVFAPFIANMTTNYNVDSSEINLTKFNKMEELRVKSQELEDKSINIDRDVNIVDVINEYFSNGYEAVRVAFSSMDIFYYMSSEAFNDLGQNIPALSYLKTALITTVIILFIVGIVMSTILKKDV